ncbi:MAG: alkaline phosphatase family protein [Thermoanaerobaculia bacterium]
MSETFGGIGVNSAASEATIEWRTLFPSAPASEVGSMERTLAGSLGKSGPVLKKIELHATSPSELRALARKRLASLVGGRGRLIVLGLDALDWHIVDELGARGLMPNLLRLSSRGAQAELDATPPLISPVIWTTLATGTEPAKHGVLDFLEQDPRDGSTRPVGSGSRKVPAVWEMTAAAHRSTAVVGWWATYPAREITDCSIYSDRLTEQLLGLETTAPKMASPLAAREAADRMRVLVTGLDPRVFKPFISLRPDEITLIRSGKTSWDEPVSGLAKLLASTATVEHLTDYELDRGTSVILSYLEGTDTVGHLFGKYRPPAQPGASIADSARFGPIVDRYYASVDQWIGTILKRLRPEDTIVVVSDHGFHWGKDRPPVASGAHTATAVWWHRPQGVFIAAGPDIAPTRSREHLRPVDVTPILLRIAGLPPGAELGGTIPPWLGPLVRRHAGTVNYAALLPRTVSRDADLPDAAKKELLAKLRALGYLGSAPAPDRKSANAPSEGSRTEARRWNNLGTSQLAGGHLDEAEADFRRAIRSDATYAPPHHNLSLLYRRQGLDDDADREFWSAVDRGLADREMNVVRLALDYREKGQLDRASSIFAEGRRRFPDSVAIWLNAGVFLGEQRQYPEARTCLQRAVELSPDSAAAHRNLALVLERTGDVDGARRELSSTLRLDPADVAAQHELERLGAHAGN